MVCAAASAGQATSRARSATLRAFIDASLVVSALLRRVGTHGLFVDRGTPARARRQEEMAVLVLRLHRHEGIGRGACRGKEEISVVAVSLKKKRGMQAKANMRC